MGVIAAFNYSAWATQFPQFSYLSDPQVTNGVLPIAQAFFANDGSGPVCIAAVQTQLLYLMVAHCAALFMPGPGGAPPSGIVGRITDAAEGSVSVSADMPTTLSSAWFNQTPYGAAFYQMSLPYRLGRYFPKISQRVQPLAQPYPPYASTPGGR